MKKTPKRRYEAKRYEGKITGGNALISVHTTSSEAVDQAKKSLRRPMPRIFPRRGNRQFKLDDAIARSQEIFTNDGDDAFPWHRVRGHVPEHQTIYGPP